MSTKLKAAGVLVGLAIGFGFSSAGADERAKQVLDATGVKGGLVVHLGCGDGKLTAALAAREGFLVHALDADAANVAAARKHIRSKGLYGRASVERFSGRRLPYADNLVRLLVAEKLGPGAPGMTEVMRVLCPNGVAYAKVGQAWQKTVKPRPKEIDEWTHFRHSAEGNMVSRDRLIGPPRHVQWVCGPIFQRHHGIVPSITTIVSATGKTALVYKGTEYTDEFIHRDGVLYLSVNDRPQKPWPGQGVQPAPPADPPKPSQKHVWAVVQAIAPDTGKELWRHESAVPISYLDTPDIFGIGDSVWITDKKTMTAIALDAATGKVKRTIPIRKVLNVPHHRPAAPGRPGRHTGHRRPGPRAARQGRQG